jgi:two-component system, NarL family, sensor histidine kinase UhpB
VEEPACTGSQAGLVRRWYVGHSGAVRHGTTSSRGLRHTPLFWRIFLLNGVVFILGVAALGLSPATVSWPLLHREMVILALGLAVMLLVNALLLRVGLGPLERLIGAMQTVDLLRPGQRLDERESGELAPLTGAFNEMLDRLESERASSAAHAISAQEAERSRIARELHDEIGQSLTVVLLELSRLSDEVPEASRPVFAEVLELARTSLADARRIAQRLRPDVLEDLGLAAALTTLADDFAQFTGVHVTSCLRPTPPLSPAAEVVVFRIAQESLTNVARHAGATRARLSLTHSPDEGVCLEVTDDGTGLGDVEGAGIRGMRERALLVRGDLRLSSPEGGGTTVRLALPPRSTGRLLDR